MVQAGCDTEMTGPVSARLGDGRRLHLQHGPIDLIVGAEDARAAAFELAENRFATILQELVDELALLRDRAHGQMALRGQTAQKMLAATVPFSDRFVTPMAAVAGAVADTVLEAMAPLALRRAYVNNGGDIALRLSPSERFDLAIARVDGADLGRIVICSGDGIGGVATSGRHGRSLSMGIADSVTVLAPSAATADAAATLIANDVDLPGHPSIMRSPACTLFDDSDLRDRLVVTDVGTLAIGDAQQALLAGRATAQAMVDAGQIAGAALVLRGETELVGSVVVNTERHERIEQHA